MASTQNNDLTVILFRPTSTLREQELDRSKALSHAARVHHERRKRPHLQPRGTKLSLLELEASHEPARNRRLKPSVCSQDPLEPTDSAQELYSSSIRHGNSDPFDCMTIRLTSHVNEMLSTWSSHIKSNPISSTSWITEIELRQDFSLDHDLHSATLIFLCSALLSSRHQDRKDLYIQALEKKRECLQLLTSKKLTDVARDSASVQVISYLFIAASFLNQVEEALWHARQLQLLMDRLKQQGTRTAADDIAVLCRLHHYDARCGIMHLRPPTLDPKHILALLLGGAAPARQWSNFRPGSDSIVRTPTFSKDIVEIFRQLQANVCYQAAPYDVEEGHPASADLFWIFCGTSLLFSHWKLSRTYISKTADDHSSLRWQDESLLSLCGLAFLGCECPGPVIASLRRRVNNVFQALRDELEQSNTLHCGEEVHQKICLWALYLGAAWESQCGLVNGDDPWFTLQLHNEIRNSRIASWDDLKHNADRFLAVPLSQAVGKSWLLGMVGQSDEPYTTRDRLFRGSADRYLTTLFGPFPALRSGAGNLSSMSHHHAICLTSP